MEVDFFTWLKWCFLNCVEIMQLEPIGGFSLFDVLVSITALSVTFNLLVKGAIKNG